MRTAVVAVVSGVVGIAIGAAGWGLLGPDHDSTDSKPAASPASAGTTAAAPDASAGHHYKSAQAIADALEAAGFTVSQLHKSADAGYMGQVGGSAYDFTVTDKAGKPAGDSGINLFPNPEAVKAWAELSKGMGGVAVTGDTWAVSLATSGDTARADSLRLAPKIAKVLGGEVQS
ncbi:hypothetical protein [Streptomyces sp. NPDC056160]|uniref:hypothetical protein n=1 Tax=Streptomyces sp. NPDC056160 TaxID=3345731 RepID=UPI0035DBF504